MLIAIIVIAAVIVILAIYVAATYNSLIKKKNSVEEAFATMDVYLKKRWDLVPNVVASVKGYAKHEAETLENVIAARNVGYQNLSTEEKLDANRDLQKAFMNFHALAERYPELKANQNFLDLNKQLSKIEADIANARKFYNAVVKEYNTKIELFPSNIVASMFKFKRKEMFQIEDETQKEAVKVEF